MRLPSRSICRHKRRARIPAQPRAARRAPGTERAARSGFELVPRDARRLAQRLDAGAQRAGTRDEALEGVVRRLELRDVVVRRVRRRKGRGTPRLESCALRTGGGGGPRARRGRGGGPALRGRPGSAKQVDRSRRPRRAHRVDPRPGRASRRIRPGGRAEARPRSLEAGSRGERGRTPARSISRRSFRGVLSV